MHYQYHSYTYKYFIQFSVVETTVAYIILTKKRLVPEKIKISDVQTILLPLQAVCSRIPSLEALRERSDAEVRSVLAGARDEEVLRLNRAMQRLRTYTGTYV